jgi:integrase
MSVGKREWNDRAGKRQRAYQVRYRDAAGKQRSQTFRRKADADAYDANITRLKRLGTLAALDAGTETLAEYMASVWLPTYGPALAEQTRRDYARLWALYVDDQLGMVPLRNLTPELLARWQADHLAAGAGPERVRKAHALLSNVLQRATEAERIQRNPAKLVRKPKATARAKPRPLAPVTVEAVRAALLDPEPTRVAAAAAGQRQRRGYLLPATRGAHERHRDAVLVSVLAYAGLRPGEALALRWSDIGETAISVSRAAALGKIKATKTGTARSVRLLAPLASDLRRWRMASGRPGGSALVFPAAAGGVWGESDWRNWTRRNLKPAFAAAGVDARPYDLRHSFASLLLHEGRNVVYVARQLGHNATLTLTTYGHVIDELEDAPQQPAVDAIEAARAGAEAKSCAHGVHIEARSPAASL